jgi:prevent-host-death family protein
MAKERVVSFVKARRELSHILDQVSNGGQPVVIAKRHKPLAVVVGLSRYREMAGAGKYLRKVKGRRILKIRGIATGVADIDEAISALRKSRINVLTRFLT